MKAPMVTELQAELEQVKAQMKVLERRLERQVVDATAPIPILNGHTVQVVTIEPSGMPRSSSLTTRPRRRTAGSVEGDRAGA
jgi:hypothetical protein